MPLLRRWSAALIGCLLLIALLPCHLIAQLEPPTTGGVVVLSQELRMLGHNRRVLMIGAHPDDEDTELLTTLVRGYGVEAAYLSLNRGEGGQNLIGSELGEGLGILRSEELLAARRLDGGRQFFTRAYDFGFSKTLTDTWAHWPKDSVLKDVVRIVRRFRPQVIVSIFSGTPRDGHGQHQAAGWAAQEAFKVAGDSSRFPELQSEEHLSAWSPLKLYRNTRFDTTGTTIRIDGGQLDPAVGQTFHQIAMRGRSLHRSQDMGQIQGMGPSENRMMLWSDRTGQGSGGLFAGIDTSLSHAATELGGAHTVSDLVRTLLDRYTESVQGVGVPNSGPASRELTKRLFMARILLEQARLACTAPACGQSELAVELADQQTHLDRALFNAEGILVDALVDDDRVIPGAGVNAILVARNTGKDTVYLCHRFDWQGVAGDGPSAVPPGQAVQWQGVFQPGAGSRLSQPYFLERPRQGDLYSWPAAADRPLIGTPFEPGLGGTVTLADPSSPTCSFGPVSFRELSYRTNDQARGEVRRPLWVVPRLDVKLDPADLIWPMSPRATRRFTVSISNNAADTARGSVALEAPAGWSRPEAKPFQLNGEGAHTEVTFDLTLPAVAKAGQFEFRAVATGPDGKRYAEGQVAVDYSHIRARVFVKPAIAAVTVAPVVLPRLARIGYVRGAADKVPEALTEAGFPIELLDRAALEHGDLSRYQAIVVGPRAYETDTALVRNNQRLLDYARAGGLVLVQYQQQVWFNGGFSPFAVTVGGPTIVPIVIDSSRGGGTRTTGFIVHDRVTDENAPVKILDPASPVFRTPNLIGASDWNGWIQERGLYFARTWDKAFHPLLEMHDPDEAPLDGSLLVARVGKGTFVYTGLSFFRQLPAGVAGPLRLLANLLALAEPAPTS